MYKLWKSNSNYKFEFKKFFVLDNTNVSLDTYTYMTTEVNIDAKCRVIQTLPTCSSFMLINVEWWRLTEQPKCSNIQLTNNSHTRNANW